MCWPILEAKPLWQAVDFISDLHLQAQEPATFEAWRRYMLGSPADAIFILGDLFEVWVGDDEAQEPGFASDCAQVLREATRLRPVFFMHGNRDFLVGAELMRNCGVTLLDDPSVLAFKTRRWLLTHGDALCLDDADYLRFRERVRTAAWQRDFLAEPLAVRKALARSMREASSARAASGKKYGDVDAEAANLWLTQANATAMIHGHTHKPADHAMDGQRQRIVLSDWDAAAVPARLEVLRLDGAAPRRINLA